MHSSVSYIRMHNIGVCRFFLTAVLALGICFTPHASLMVDDSVIKIPMTIYAYHTDGSCPAFGPNNYTRFTKCGFNVFTTYTGIVKPVLGPGNKPEHNPLWTRCALYDNVDKWFVSTQLPDTCTFTTIGDTTYRHHDSTMTCSCIFGGTDCEPADTLCLWSWLQDTIRNPSKVVHSDTCFKNIVVHDSLLLYKANGNFYRRGWPAVVFYDTTWERAEFMRGRGFPGDSFPYFSIEIHNSFIYRGGEKIKIGGNNSTWTFINKNIVADLGGEKWGAYKTVLLDTIGSVSGQKLTVGQAYSFGCGYFRLTCNALKIHELQKVTPVFC